MWWRAACFALPTFVPERLFILSVLMKSAVESHDTSDPQSQQQQQNNRNIVLVVTPFRLPMATCLVRIHSMRDDIMWVAYKCFHGDVWGTGRVPPVTSTGIQIYSHILFLGAPSHPAPRCLNEMYCQIVRKVKTDVYDLSVSEWLSFWYFMAYFTGKHMYAGNTAAGRRLYLFIAEE